MHLRLKKYRPVQYKESGVYVLNIVYESKGSGAIKGISL